MLEFVTRVDLQRSSHTHTHSNTYQGNCEEMDVFINFTVVLTLQCKHVLIYQVNIP